LWFGHINGLDNLHVELGQSSGRFTAYADNAVTPLNQLLNERKSNPTIGACNDCE
jgi:hypothetical protein